MCNRNKYIMVPFSGFFDILILTMALGMSLVIVIVWMSRSPSPPSSVSEVFRQRVCDPIPESVTNLMLDRSDTTRTKLCVMHFKISKEDLMSIVNSRPFKEFDWIKYRREEGSLIWGQGSHPFGLRDTDGRKLYTPTTGIIPPDWFRPNELQNPKVYVQDQVDGKNKTRILIYDESRSEAYFIEYHHWGF
jgi:hypothetical protein